VGPFQSSSPFKRVCKSLGLLCAAVPAQAAVASARARRLSHRPALVLPRQMSESEEDIPLAQLAERKKAEKPTTIVKRPPARSSPAPRKRAVTDYDDDEDDDDDYSAEQDSDEMGGSKRSGQHKSPAAKRSRREGSSGPDKPKKGKDGAVMWQTLKHEGVLFPPEYVPHGVKMLCECAQAS
jgi:hypothetical protein